MSSVRRSYLGRPLLATETTNSVERAAKGMAAREYREGSQWAPPAPLGRKRRGGVDAPPQYRPRARSEEDSQFDWEPYKKNADRRNSISQPGPHCSPRKNRAILTRKWTNGSQTITRCLTGSGTPSEPISADRKAEKQNRKWLQNGLASSARHLGCRCGFVARVHLGKRAGATATKLGGACTPAALPRAKDDTLILTSDLLKFRANRKVTTPNRMT